MSVLFVLFHFVVFPPPPTEMLVFVSFSVARQKVIVA